MLEADESTQVLWAMVGRTLVEALTILSGTPTTASVLLASSAPAEGDISDSLTLLLETMAAFEQKSPLISEFAMCSLSQEMSLNLKQRMSWESCVNLR